MSDELAAFLHAAGLPAERITYAEEHGLLPLLAVDELILADLEYDVDEVAEHTGIGKERLLALWGALGFAAPGPGEEIFSADDLEQFRAVVELVDSGIADPEVIVQFTRVLGSSMARIAASQAEILATRRADGPFGSAGGAEWFGETFDGILSRVWRRHLQAAARARLSAPLGPEGATTTVGFADLVGFTALSQQLDSATLAAIVDRFESVAYATIGSHGGRVVKMIGDEVMFAIDDPVAAARCALALSESYHEADDLSDVRVGLAHGEVIDRDGDLFGPPVNLASRMTSIAYPGSVVIDEHLRDLLRDVGDLELRPMRPRRLKHIGLVRLFSLRTDEDEDIAQRRRDRRRARLTELTLGLLGDEDDDDGNAGDDVDGESE